MSFIIVDSLTVATVSRAHGLTGPVGRLDSEPYEMSPFLSNLDVMHTTNSGAQRGTAKVVLAPNFLIWLIISYVKDSPDTCDINQAVLLTHT